LKKLYAHGSWLTRKQLLEQIGVTARSSKTAAQRAAPAKAAATRAAKKEQG
jgi:hypothetical protein